MFDLIAAGHQRTPHTDTVPLLLSWGLHLIAGGALVVVPLLMAAHDLPVVPSMMAFVAPEPVAAPPPPPPPPAASRSAEATPKPVPSSNPAAAPIEAPSSVTPEPPAPAGGDQGVPGGVEGGVAGGVLGGIVGGIPHDAPAPPPPPPPPPAPAQPKGPVRIGGEVSQPALLKRVDPVYPEMAVAAQVEGVVILEAVVDREGRVEDVQVLRSLPLLDNAAKEAVRQWRYSPLLLNGKAERFILTVTVSFRLKRDK